MNERGSCSTSIIVRLDISPVRRSALLCRDLVSMEILSTEKLLPYLNLTAKEEFSFVPDSRTLSSLFEAWAATFPTDASKLHSLAMHDLRMTIQESAMGQYLEMSPGLSISKFLGQKARTKWDEIRKTCEWDLPTMSLPAWSQHLFGAVILSGFVLPFFFPLPGSLVLPVVLPLSFWMENRATWLEYPTFDAMAARMVDQNAPGIELSKFLPEDIERMFFQLCCMATGKELDPGNWRSYVLC